MTDNQNTNPGTVFQIVNPSDRHPVQNRIVVIVTRPNVGDMVQFTNGRRSFSDFVQDVSTFVQNMVNQGWVATTQA
jgi:hypothetical protein